MDSDLVRGKLSSNDGGKVNADLSPVFSYAKIFEQQCPFYLSIGMTYDQFWNDSPEIAVHYRKAHRIKMERDEFFLWAQGLYFYNALCNASPLLHAFAKKGVKAGPYPEEPFGLFASKKTREINEELKEKKVADRGKAMMYKMMAAINKKMKKEGDNANTN